MKTTDYFQETRTRPDRAWIRDEWIERVVGNPEAEQTQEDGRIRRWRRIAVHNAFFDRRLKS